LQNEVENKKIKFQELGFRLLLNPPNTGWS